MKPLKLFASGIALTACALLAFVVREPALADDGGDVERGKQLYYDHACYGCHGYDGKTGARDLVGTDSPILASVEAFVAFLRLRGDVMPLFPSTAMPSYPEAALGAAEARDIYAYIRSIETDAPDAADVPVLEAIIESVSGP